MINSQVEKIVRWRRRKKIKYEIFSVRIFPWVCVFTRSEYLSSSSSSHDESFSFMKNCQDKQEEQPKNVSLPTQNLGENKKKVYIMDFLEREEPPTHSVGEARKRVSKTVSSLFDWCCSFLLQTLLLLLPFQEPFKKIREDNLTPTEIYQIFFPLLLFSAVLMMSVFLCWRISTLSPVYVLLCKFSLFGRS